MHAGHSPAAAADSDPARALRRLLLAMCLTAGFMVVEVVGGVVSGSLALIADAGHMLTDTAALGLAWLAAKVSDRPPDQRRSYGYRRFEVLAAFINGITLALVVVWIVWEAVSRLFEPVEVLGGMMMAVAVAGLLVNLIAFRLLHGGGGDNINIRGAALHVLGDLLGSAAAIVAALVILATGWTPIDPLLSLVVALLILRSTWLLLKRSTHILLEGTPDGIDVDRIGADLVAFVPGLLGVHHVHVWDLGSGSPVITLHGDLGPQADYQDALQAIHARLKTRHRISHATVQLERGACADDLYAQG